MSPIRIHAVPVAPSRRSAFTLIEVLVVVAIIALLIAILLPSLRAARNQARGAACGSNMRTVTTAGSMWMMQEKKERVPAHRGWVPHVLKIVKGQTDVFRCPADLNPKPLAALMVSQHRPGFTYPTLSTDSGYFRRRRNQDDQGYHVLEMETEADVAGGDADFDDAFIHFRPIGTNLAETYARKGGTGRRLDLHDMHGRVLATDFSTTPPFKLPLIYGSFGMNLSAALPGMKPWHALYADYSEWSVVTERGLNVLASGGGRREDNPARMANLLHMNKANVAFLDTHVELVAPARLEKTALWHPPRPPNFFSGLKLD